MATGVFIVGGARTPIGTFGGTLKHYSPTALGAAAAKAAIERSGLAPADVDNSVFGTVIPTEAADLFLGRTVGIESGLPDDTQGFTVNRLCGSGVQAIVSAVQMIQLNESKIAIAGGAEAMSRSPMSVNGMRFGQRMGNGVIYDWLTSTLADPFGHGAMGRTGENVAEKYQISRERQDQFALTSQGWCPYRLVRVLHRRVRRRVRSGRPDGSRGFGPREEGMEGRGSVRGPSEQG